MPSHTIASYCPGCGTKIDTVSEQRIVCASCGLDFAVDGAGPEDSADDWQSEAVRLFSEVADINATVDALVQSSTECMNRSNSSILSTSELRLSGKMALQRSRQKLAGEKSPTS
jgi:hypothetical protein